MPVKTAPCVQSRIYMDTTVSIEIRDAGRDGVEERVEKAFGWFREVERRCSRFDEASELRSVCRQAGRPVQVSPLLFHALKFSLSVAQATKGAFDPTVGLLMEEKGFDRNYQSGERAASGIAKAGADYRDLILDGASRTVTLRRPLLLDLGAVAKGFAIDLAAAELDRLGAFCIDAGGDVLVRGGGTETGFFPVGIRNPRRPDELFALLQVSDVAVCTSGDYERRNRAGESHIMTPSSRRPAASFASVTVVAPGAMLADALSTAAFVLGPERGIALLEQEGVEGLFIREDLSSRSTKGMAAYLP